MTHFQCGRSMHGVEAAASPAPVEGEHRVVLRKPGFRIDGRDLFFLISRRAFARLSESEIRLWGRVGEGVALGDLCREFGPEAEDIVDRFRQLGVCDVAASRFAVGRRRILVIEPHSDDAALSVGGTMWLRRNECEFTIATIASRSNFTSYFYSLDRAFLSVDQVSRLRAEEGGFVARCLGGRYVALGLPEATVRYCNQDWTLDWFRRHHYSARASIGRFYEQAELTQWTTAIERLVQESGAQEIWMPMGVGYHCDHQLARDACLQVLMRVPSISAAQTVRLYQDVPYAARNAGYSSCLTSALERAGAILESEVVAVDDAFDEKLRLISAFGSQFKCEALRPEIEASARLASPAGGMAEKMWLVRKPPETLCLRSLYYHRDVVQELASPLLKWYHRSRDARRIRVLLSLPAGRWGSDAAKLLEALPHSTLDVYVTPAGLAEVEAAPSDRIAVHPISRGPRAWISLAVKLAVTSPAPTIFVANATRVRGARRLAALWPLSSTLVISSFDHFHMAFHAMLNT